MKAFVVFALSVTLAHGGFLGNGGFASGGGGGGHDTAADFGGAHNNADFDGSGVVEPRSANAGQDEDNAALSAVGLSRLLGGGGLSGHGTSVGGGGSSYTISGPTQVIKSVHKITTTHSGGQVLSRSGGAGAGQGGQAKIIIIKADGGHGGSDHGGSAFEGSGHGGSAFEGSGHGGSAYGGSAFGGSGYGGSGHGGSGHGGSGHGGSGHGGSGHGGDGW